MAASVRIDDGAFMDPRVKRLGRLLGTSVFDALGRLAFVWRYCTERQLYAVGDVTLADLTDCEDFGAHLIAAELGERAGDLVRIRGLEGRIEWLGERRAAARKGGRARAERAERGADGRLVSAKRQPNAGATLEAVQPNVGGRVPANQPNASPPVPSPAPVPSLPTEESGAALPLFAGGSSVPADSQAKPKKPAKEPSEQTLLRDWWLEAFREATGSEHSWSAREAGQASQLLRMGGGLAGVQARAEVLLGSRCPGWIAKGGRDLGTLLSQWNKLAPGAASSGTRGGGLQVEDFLAAAEEFERRGV